MGRLDLMDRILTSFRRSAGQEIEELFTAISQADRDAILHKAHKLKGTSLTASANSLADVADALHRTAQEAQPCEFGSFSEKLTCEFDTILRLLDARDESGSFHEPN